MALGSYALTPLDVNANNNNVQTKNQRQQSNLRKQSDYHIVQKPVAKGLHPASDDENVPPQSQSQEKPSTPQDGQMNQTPVKKKTNKKLLCNTPPVNLYSKKSKTEYDRGRQLGEGGFARCYLVQNRAGEFFAVKTVAKKSLQSEKMKSKFFGEIQVHKSMIHPNIVRYVECFEDNDNIYMILELCQNKSLVEMIRKRGRITEPEARFYMLQILGALKYMHSKRVIHRDLKLGNIFLDDQMNIKIGDFGLAALLADENDRKTTMCGTPNYIAPEVLFGKKSGHSFEVDLWSCGVILYAMLVGKPPFQASDINTIYQKIRDTDFEWPPDVYISPSAKELVHALLEKNPQKRPSLDNIADFAFFRNGFFPRLIPSTATRSEPIFKTSTGVTIIPGAFLTPSAKADSRKNYLNVAKNSGIGVDDDGKPMPCVGGDPDRPASALALKTENKQDTRDISVASARSNAPPSVKQSPPAEPKPVTREVRVKQIAVQEKGQYMLPESLSPRDGHARMRNAGLLKNLGRLPSLGSRRKIEQDNGKGLAKISEEALVPPPKMAKLGRAGTNTHKKNEVTDLDEEKDEVPPIAAVLAERPRRGIASNIVAPKLPDVYSVKATVTRRKFTGTATSTQEPEPQPSSLAPLSRAIDPPVEIEPVPAPTSIAASRPRRIVQPSAVTRQIRTVRSTAIQRTTAGGSEVEPAEAPRVLRRTRSTVGVDHELILEPTRKPAASIEEVIAKPIRTGLTGRPRRAIATQRELEPAVAQVTKRPPSSSTSTTTSGIISATSRCRPTEGEPKTVSNTQLSPIQIPSTAGSLVIASAHVYYSALTALLTSNLSGLGPTPKETLAATRAYKNRESNRYPFVTRWADYTNKCGIGYTLADGTIGSLWNDNTALIIDSMDKIDAKAQYCFEGRVMGNTGKGETAYQMLKSDIESLCAFAKHDKDHYLHSKIRNWRRLGSWIISNLDNLHKFTRDKRDELLWVTTFARTESLTFFRLSNGTIQFNYQDRTKIILSNDGRTIRFLGMDQELRVLSLEDALEIIQAGSRAKKIFVEADFREKMVLARQFLKTWIKTMRVCGDMVRKEVSYPQAVENEEQISREEKSTDESRNKIATVLGDVWG